MSGEAASNTGSVIVFYSDGGASLAALTSLSSKPRQEHRKP
jgi:hypothetical protein